MNSANQSASMAAAMTDWSHFANPLENKLAQNAEPPPMTPTIDQECLARQPENKVVRLAELLVDWQRSANYLPCMAR